MEATTIMWRTTSEELPIIVRALRHEIERAEERAKAYGGYMYRDHLPADYELLLSIYNKMEEHL